MISHTPLHDYRFFDVLCGKSVHTGAEFRKGLAGRFESLPVVKPFYAREAILEHLSDLEDLYLAEQRRIDIQSEKIKTVALDEVMKRYGVKD